VQAPRNSIIVVVSSASIAWGEGHVAIDVQIKPAGTFRAETKKIKGSAYKTDDGVAAENVLVDLRTLATGISLRDKHLKNHLDVETFPIAQLKKASGSGGQGQGTIYIKGQNQEVHGTYKINGKRLEAKFKMKLSDLKITGVRYMGAGVADEVTVTVDLPLESAAKKVEKKHEKTVEKKHEQKVEASDESADEEKPKNKWDDDDEEKGE
jgi:hypothetical protein